jgi:hypothetical protein
VSAAALAAPPAAPGSVPGRCNWVLAQADRAVSGRRVLGSPTRPLPRSLTRRIITAMHQKLAFARNPRFPLPPQVRCCQRASCPACRMVAEWLTVGGLPCPPLPPQVKLLHASLPSKPSFGYRALGSTAGAAARQVAAAAATPGMGVFRLEPPEVVFTDYGELCCRRRPCGHCIHCTHGTPLHQLPQRCIRLMQSCMLSGCQPR